MPVYCSPYKYLGEAFYNALQSHRSFYSHVLDVGCGYGIATGFMRIISNKMWLVDPSPDVITEQTQHWIQDHNVTIQLGTIHSIEGQFDLIYYFLSLHHIFDTYSELRKAKELLSPDGVLAICEVVPNDSIPFHGPEMVPYDGFTPDQIIKILNDNKFIVKQQLLLGTLLKNTMEYDIFVLICLPA